MPGLQSILVIRCSCTNPNYWGGIGHTLCALNSIAGKNNNYSRRVMCSILNMI